MAQCRSAPTPRRHFPQPDITGITAMSTTSLINFSFCSNNIRVVTDENGEPWFVAADVCAALEIGNPSDAIKRVDEEDRTLVSIEGLQINVLSESGLYSLVLGSRKPEAKAFKRWITSEVLPSIRKTGGYSLADDPRIPKTFGQALQLAADQQRQIEAQQEQIKQMQPKADFHDEVIKQGEELTIREALKVIFNRSIQERQLVSWLFNQGWLCKRGKGREPTAYAIDNGYMRCRYDYLPQIHQTVLVAVFTGKGVAYLRHLYKTGDLFTSDIDRALLLPKPDRAV